MEVVVGSPIPIFGLVMAVGLIGTVVPAIPGLVLIWVTALAYGSFEGFGIIGWIAMVVITALLCGGLAAKVMVPKRRATAGGAPPSTLVFGAIVGLIGFFTVPIVGLPLGGIAGVLVAEYRRTREWKAARRSTRSVIVGLGIGALLELGAGMAMILSWLVWALVQA